MTGGQRSVALWIACSLAASCELTLSAESSAPHCRDGRENDGDDFIDCADSDCWVYAHCRQGGQPPDAGAPLVPPEVNEEPPPSTGKPPRVPSDDGTIGTPPAISDAGISRDASAPDAEVDAFVPPHCEGCPEGACIEGVCMEPPEPVGRYRVVSLRMIAPTARELPLNVSSCFDTNRACLEVVVGCCDPDPILTMHVDGKLVAELHSQNTVDRLWSEPDIEIELKLGSKIEFELKDDDSGDLDASGESGLQDLFWCWLHATEEHLSATASIDCLPTETLFTASDQPIGVTARLVAKPPSAP